MSDIIDPPSEARIIPNGEPVEGGMTLFQGSLAGVRQFIAEMAPADRPAVSIWTAGHIFSANKLAAEQPGHEHDPLA